jgi:hypothetical protein
MKNSDKTIPYRLSPAELENLRLLRERMSSSSSGKQKETQPKTSGAGESSDSELYPRTQKAEQQSP